MKPMFKTPLITFGLSLCALVAIADKTVKPNKKTVKYIDPSNMDLSVKPGDNFYQYANGAWLKTNPVPSSKTRWGSFDVLREESSQRLRVLLNESAGNTAKDRATQMIGDFYASGMDSAAIEAKGYTPVKPDLDRISAIGNLSEAIREIASLRTVGYGSVLFSMNVGPDRKKVTEYIPQLGQGGTTMPDRDYYLKDDPRSVKVRNTYKAYVQKMFALIGEDEKTAAASMDAILRIETALAKAQYSRVEMRDPYKLYNKFSLKDLGAVTPGLDWSTLFKQMKVQVGDSVLVSNPSFLKIADALLSALPLQDWKTYLRWNVLKSSAAYLSKAFVDEQFKFSQSVSGQKEPTPRWQRMSALIDGSLGEMLGQLYVSRYFKPEAKERMVELVNNLQSTFEDRIKRLGLDE